MIFHEKEVVVSAARLPTPYKKSPWSAQIIDKDQIQRLNAKTVADVLSSVSGVDVKSNGYVGSVATVRLRGGRSEGVLVLLNGQRINSPLLGQTDLSIFPVDGIEKIEVVKAPLSSVYGADASSGVINIITEKKEPEKQDIGFSLKLGSFQTNSQNLTLAFNKTPFDFGLQAARQASEGFRANSDLLLESYLFDIGLLKNKTASTRLNFLRTISGRGVPGVPDTTSWSASTPYDRLADDNTFVSLLQDIDLSRVKVHSSLFYNQLNQTDKRYDSFSGTFANGSYKSWQTGASVNADILVRDNVRADAGFEAREDIGNSTNTGIHRVGNTAYFFEARLTEPKPYVLEVGGRADFHSVFGSYVSPRIGVACGLSPDLTLRVGLGNSFRAPTLNELYWNDPIWQLYGNQNLLPEQAQEFDLGLNYDVLKDAELSLDLFRSSMSNQISWNWDASTGRTTAVNVNSSSVIGAEFNFLSKNRPGVEFSFNSTCQRAVQDSNTFAANSGKLLPYTPELKANLGIIFFPIKLLETSVRFRYVGKQFADGANTYELPAYYTADLFLRRDFGLAKLLLSVDNLFDTVYYESAGSHPVTFEPKNYPMPGRTFFVGIEIKN